MSVDGDFHRALVNTVRQVVAQLEKLDNDEDWIEEDDVLEIFEDAKAIIAFEDRWRMACLWGDGPKRDDEWNRMEAAAKRAADRLSEGVTIVLAR